MHVSKHGSLGVCVWGGGGGGGVDSNAVLESNTSWYPPVIVVVSLVLPPPHCIYPDLGVWVVGIVDDIVSVALQVKDW